MTQLDTRRPGRLAVGTPVHEFRALDTYAGGLSDEAPRLEALATISAGRKVLYAGDNPAHKGKSFPQAAKRDDERHIYLHDTMGRAPGLAAALEAGHYRRLTVAFPFDDPAAFVQQRFVAYSATALLAYGDQDSMTIIRLRKDSAGKIAGASSPPHGRSRPRVRWRRLRAATPSCRSRPTGALFAAPPKRRRAPTSRRGSATGACARV